MMQIHLMCTECIKEAIKRGDAFVDEFMVPMSEVKDVPVYDVVCAKGHKTKAVLTNQKFEVLFDLGVNAVIDGYPREAVSSFTAALERFYEFAIKVMLVEKQGQEMFASTWRTVSNQSERQVGAFVFMFSYVIGEIPKTLSTAEIGLRNEVIHKGKIPSIDEALNFGEKVRDVVNAAIIKLNEKYKEKLIQICVSEQEAYAQQYGCEGGCNIPSILDARSGGKFETDDIRLKSLKEILPIIIKNRVARTMKLSKNLPAM